MTNSNKSTPGWAFVFMLALFIAGVSPGHAAQQSALTTGQSSKLLALVGQKCSLVLRAGARVKGALWDFDEASITIKVKKGLLYSKTEQHKIADIDYFEDAAGNRISFATSGKAAEKSPPATLIFSIDDTQPPAKSGDAKTTTAAPAASPAQKTAVAAEERELEKMLSRIAGRSETDAARETAQKKNFPQTAPSSRKATSSESPRQQSRAKGRRPHNSKVASQTRSKDSSSQRGKSEALNQTPARPANSGHSGLDSSGKESQPAGTQTMPAMRRAASGVGQRSASTADEIKKMRVLRYQTLILFGVAAFAILVVILARMLGMRSKAYAKNTLFPSKLVKMNGRFGILDQGLEDGVKVDDLVRLYRKIDKKIFYRGVVRVRKVAENYAMVEVVRRKKGVRLQVGDVGLRDRNFVAASLKRLRIFTSRALSGIGRVFLLTARGVAIKEDEPTVEFDLAPDVEAAQVQQIPGREVTVVNTETDEKKVSTSRPQKGFGFDRD